MLEEFDDPQPEHRDPAPEKKTRWGRRIAAIFGGIAFLVVAAGVAYLGFLNHIVSSNVTQAPLLPSSAPSATVTGPDGAETTVAIDGRGENYLLIGSDARPGETVSRSDVMVLVHIPENKSKVYLVHFPRDLYVDIPGHGKNKINASYAFGGAPLLVTTLQNLIGVKIDHVAKTDFNGFATVTDAVGGVRVWAEEASSGQGQPGAKAIVKGWNDLNGAQALAFVRERYELSQGDISRGRRQMAFVKALMLKTLSPDVLLNPVKLSGFVDAATDNLVVDNALSVSDMRSEALGLRHIRGGDIVFITAPFTGFGSVPGVGSIDVVDLPGMARLGEAIRNDTLDQYGDVSSIP